MAIINTRMTDGGGGTKPVPIKPVPIKPVPKKPPANAYTDTGTGTATVSSPVEVVTPKTTPLHPKIPIGAYTDTGTGTAPAIVTPKPVAEEAKDIADIEKGKEEPKPIPKPKENVPPSIPPKQEVTPLPEIKREQPTTAETFPVKPDVQAKTPEQIQKEQGILDELANMLAQENQYITQLNEMKFDYNPATDPNFLRDASTLENTVTQMMVGRGGVYSSVAQSALQSRLASLQLDYSKMKYDEFKQERAYMLDLAQSEQNRRNTYFNQMMDINSQLLSEEKWRVEQDQIAWENDWKEIQYKQNLIDQQMQREWEIEDRNRAVADAIAQKDSEIAAAQLQADMNDAKSRYTEFIYQRTAFDNAMNKWKNSPLGIADYTVVSAFSRLGITLSHNARYSESYQKIQAAESKLNTYQQQVQSELYRLNMQSDYLDLINNVLYPKTQPIGETTTTTTTMDKDLNETTVKTTVPVYPDEQTSTTQPLFPDTILPDRTTGRTNERQVQ